MNYDEIVLGVGNSEHPANQEQEDLNGYGELAKELHKDKMRLYDEIFELHSKLNEIKYLCQSLSDNGLAILILNKI